MAPITANFTSESPLAPAVVEAIQAALEQGWADPKKISQASSKASALKAAALDEMAAILQVRASEIEICGEPELVPYLAIAGLGHHNLPLATTAVDKGKVRAVARGYQGPQSVLPVSQMGEVDTSQLEPQSLLIWQSINGETGARHSRIPNSQLLVYEATSDLPHHIPDQATLALFDSRAWNGPAGIGFLVIKDSQKYRYPLPHIAPIRTPGSYSLPLLLGSVIAAQLRLSETSVIAEHRLRLTSALDHTPQLTIVDAVGSEKSPNLSLLVEGISNQEFMAHLSRAGIDIDAGSACSPEDLAPSHVIAAMGLPTTGHIRITLRNDHNAEDIDYCAVKIKETLNSLRS